MIEALRNLSIAPSFWAKIIGDFNVNPQASVCEALDPALHDDISASETIFRDLHVLSFYTEKHAINFHYYPDEDSVIITQIDRDREEVGVRRGMRQYWNGPGGEISCHGDWRARVQCYPNEFEVLREKIAGAFHIVDF